MSKLTSSLLILWAGSLLGVSFIAAPVKFTAPHLTMSVALEIGQVTFHLFNKVEWLLSITLITMGLYGRVRHVLIIALLMFIFLATESFYLLPILDANANLVIAGHDPTPNLFHWAYIILDILKLTSALLGSLLIIKLESNK